MVLIKMHIGGNALAGKLVPQAVRAVRIMVAGQQVPVNGAEITHPLKRLVEGALRERFHVIDIAGDKVPLALW